LLLKIFRDSTLLSVTLDNNPRYSAHQRFTPPSWHHWFACSTRLSSQRWFLIWSLFLSR